MTRGRAVWLAALLAAGPAAAGTHGAAAGPAVVLQMAGRGSAVWAFLERGGRVSLWRQAFSGPWRRLAWPAGQVPATLTRVSAARAWVVTTADGLWRTTDGGRRWQSVALPPLLAAHAAWAQAVMVAPVPGGGVVLGAWGPAAMSQQAKLIWYRPPRSGRWRLESRSAPYGVDPTPWWPRGLPATLPLPGDPVALRMVSPTTGYLVVGFGSPPFLLRVDADGQTVAPARIRGLPHQDMAPGTMAWAGSAGWMVGGRTPATAMVVRLEGTDAWMATATPDVNGTDGLAVAAAGGGAATVATMAGHVWTLFNTGNGGRSWTAVPVPTAADPGAAPPVLYRHGDAVWLLLGSTLYEGPDGSGSGWRAVPLP